MKYFFISICILFLGCSKNKSISYDLINKDKKNQKLYNVSKKDKVIYKSYKTVLVKYDFFDEPVEEEMHLKVPKKYHVFYTSADKHIISFGRNPYFIKYDGKKYFHQKVLTVKNNFVTVELRPEPSLPISCVYMEITFNKNTLEPIFFNPGGA